MTEPASPGVSPILCIGEDPFPTFDITEALVTQHMGSLDFLVLGAVALGAELLAIQWFKSRRPWFIDTAVPWRVPAIAGTLVTMVLIVRGLLLALRGFDDTQGALRPVVDCEQVVTHLTNALLMGIAIIEWAQVVLVGGSILYYRHRSR